MSLDPSVLNATSTVMVVPWHDPIVDAVGFDVRSQYVELFWLNVLAARELDDQRDNAFVRKVRTLERFVDFDQHHIQAEIGGTQMRTNQFEVVRGQRGQKSILRTRG
mgnify:CR=1 FL=1